MCSAFDPSWQSAASAVVAVSGDGSGQSLQGHSRVLQWEAGPAVTGVQLGGKEVQVLVLGDAGHARGA